MAFLSEKELLELGLKRIGINVKIDSSVVFIGAKKVSIGDNVRIDHGCLISAGEKGISIGSHIHIAAYVLLYGEGGIEIHDFVGISSRCALYSASDDYSGRHLIGPIIDDKFLSVRREKILLKKLSSIGTNSTLLPGATLEEGAVLGGHSMLSKTIPAWEIWTGTPPRKLANRNKNALTLSSDFQKHWDKISFQGKKTKG